MLCGEEGHALASECLLLGLLCKVEPLLAHLVHPSQSLFVVFELAFAWIECLGYALVGAEDECGCPIPMHLPVSLNRTHTFVGTQCTRPFAVTAVSENS